MSCQIHKNPEKLFCSLFGGLNSHNKSLCEGLRANSRVARWNSSVHVFHSHFALNS